MCQVGGRSFEFRNLSLLVSLSWLHGSYSSTVCFVILRENVDVAIRLARLPAAPLLFSGPRFFSRMCRKIVQICTSLLFSIIIVIMVHFFRLDTRCNVCSVLVRSRWAIILWDNSIIIVQVYRALKHVWLTYELLAIFFHRVRVTLTAARGVDQLNSKCWTNVQLFLFSVRRKCFLW